MGTARPLAAKQAKITPESRVAAAAVSAPRGRLARSPARPPSCQSLPQSPSPVRSPVPDSLRAAAAAAAVSRSGARLPLPCLASPAAARPRAFLQPFLQSSAW